MKKYIAGALVIALFVAGGAGAFLILTNQDKAFEPIVTSNSSVTKTSKVDACDTLTESIVTEWLGKKVQKIATPVATLGSSDSQVSTCNYVVTDIQQGNIESEGPKLSGANLLVYIANSASGAEANKSQFKEKPENTTDVSGVGDDAFYNPDFRQLHVLKGNNWYVLTAYKDSILNSTVETTTDLAKKIKFE